MLEGSVANSETYGNDFNSYLADHGLSQCHYSYSGYNDRGGCDGSFCETSDNCVSGCCFNNHCGDPSVCFGSVFKWIYWAIIVSTLVCTVVYAIGIVKRRRKLLAIRSNPGSAATLSNHSDAHVH